MKTEIFKILDNIIYKYVKFKQITLNNKTYLQQNATCLSFI